MAWHRTGVKAADLKEDAPVGVVLDGRSVLVVRVAGRLIAADGACPHIGGDLSEGTVELGKITCPLHGATFDLATGAVRADPFGVSPPEGGVGPLAIHPIRETDGELEVEL